MQNYNTELILKRIDERRKKKKEKKGRCTHRLLRVCWELVATLLD